MFLGVEERAAKHGLRLLEVDALDTVAARVSEHKKSLWYYYPPFLIGQARAAERRVFVGEIEGSLVLLIYRSRRRRETCDLIVPPLPFAEGPLRKGLLAAHDLAPNARHRIMWCDEADARQIEQAGLGELSPSEPDLLYNPARVAALAGREYRDVRKAIMRLERESDIRARRGAAEDLPSCRLLLQQWFEARVDDIRPIGDMGYTRGALTAFPSLAPHAMELRLYEVNGEPAALAIGGDIRPDLMCFFALKALPGVRGLATYARWEALSHWRDRGLVNDGSDLGRPGLRQQKRKFRPVGEMAVWQVDFG